VIHEIRDWPSVMKLAGSETRLTMLVIIETTNDEHPLRSQMGTESDCLFGQSNRILWISDYEA